MSLQELGRNRAILPCKGGERRLHREHSRHAEQFQPGRHDRCLTLAAAI
jgi:hypothetical protein